MIKLPGRWSIGYAFDYHTSHSSYCGKDEFGRDIFQTERTEMGELLYQLKYKSAWNQTYDLIRKIIDLLSADKDFIKMMSEVDVILTVPPSNKYRYMQPVIHVAKELAAKFRKGLDTTLLQNSNTEQVKNLDTQDKYNLVSGTAIIQYHLLNQTHRYLIFDDIFDSGSTLRVYSDRLQEYGCPHVSVLTLTKTRNSR